MDDAYKDIPTTNRPGERLARRHGFRNLNDLAHALPPKARVLDVGAGDSNLGLEVITLRPDIEWINFDYSYKQKLITCNKPRNIQYIFGDATKLASIYPAESFDAVFSYWLFPHLSLYKKEPAFIAAQGIYTITKSGGFISIGPKFWSPQHTYRIRKDKIVDRDSFARKTVRATQLGVIGRFAQRMINEVMTPFFGTTRYVSMQYRTPLIFDPMTRVYVHPLSIRGLTLARRLSVAAFKHIGQGNKAQLEYHHKTSETNVEHRQ